MTRGEFKEEDFKEEKEENIQQDKIAKNDEDKSLNESKTLADEENFSKKLKEKWNNFSKRRSDRKKVFKKYSSYEELKESLLFDTLYHANHFFKLCNFFLWLGVIALIISIVVFFANL